MSQEAIGVVLAGGESRRFGSDKSVARIDGFSLLERATGKMQRLLPRVVVSVSERPVEDSASELVVDLRPGQGPLAGLEAALEYADGMPVLVLACDLPNVDERVLRRILEISRTSAGRDVAAAWIARSGREHQPLCGLYSPRCLGVVKRQLDRGRRSVRELLRNLEVTDVDVADCGRDVLANVNRPIDLKRVGLRAN